MILGIHGLKADVEKYNFWPKFNCEYKGRVDIPQLPNNDKTVYNDWKKEFEKINFNEYDIIVAHSMGCRILFEYLVENKIKVKKLLFLSPAFSSFTNKKDKNGLLIKREELDYTYKTLNNYYLLEDNIKYFSNLIDELILFHSKDDYRISHLGIRYFINNFDRKKIKIIHKKEFGHFLGKDDLDFFKKYLK